MKSVEALKRIETTFSGNKRGENSVYASYTNSAIPYYEDYNCVMKALKILNILKKRRVDIDREIYDPGDYETYLTDILGLKDIDFGFDRNTMLEPDEFYLLKEWLEEDE